ELEGTARRRTGRRNVISVGSLLCFGADEGAAALGLDAWPDVEVNLEHPSLAGIDGGDVFAALVFGCSAEVELRIEAPTLEQLFADAAAAFGELVRRDGGDAYALEVGLDAGDRAAL